MIRISKRNDAIDSRFVNCCGNTMAKRLFSDPNTFLEQRPGYLECYQWHRLCPNKASI